MHGTWKTEGGDGDAWKVVAVAAAILVLSGGGSAAAAVAGIAAAAVDLLYWVAGTLYGTALVAGVAWVATRHRRAEIRAQNIALLERKRQEREEEIEQRHARRALASAHAQAQAWAPMIAGLAATLQQPAPHSVPAIPGEVVKQ